MPPMIMLGKFSWRDLGIILEPAVLDGCVMYPQLDLQC
jgi:hypothetical protein